MTKHMMQTSRIYLMHPYEHHVPMKLGTVTAKLQINVHCYMTFSIPLISQSTITLNVE